MSETPASDEGAATARDEGDLLVAQTGRASEARTVEAIAAEHDVGERRVSQVAMDEVDRAQVRAAEVTAAQARVLETAAPKIGVGEVGALERLAAVLASQQIASLDGGGRRFEVTRESAAPMHGAARCDSRAGALSTTNGARRASRGVVDEHSTVIVVAANPVCRASMVAYLTDSGFRVGGVRGYASVPKSASAIVWLTSRTASPQRIREGLLQWVAVRRRHAIVVTWQTRPFRSAVAATRGRIAVLPAGSFAWQIVDALRAYGIRPPREPRA